MTNFLDTITATAVSFTVAGNTGISPFLTLFLVGLLESWNPSLLEMNETMESWLASWPALFLLGTLSILEFIGKCVPIIDEIIDSIMTFVIPFISVLGSLSTMGLLEDSLGISESFNNYVHDDEGGEQRRSLSTVSNVLWILKIIIIVIGIGLALGMHLIKMLVRLVGEGWLTNILTVLEVTYVIMTITLAIYIKPIAILVACCIVMAATFSLKRKYFDKEDTTTTAQGFMVTTTTSSSSSSLPTNSTPPVTATVVGEDKPVAQQDYTNTMEQGKVVGTGSGTATTTDYVKM